MAPAKSKTPDEEPTPVSPADPTPDAPADDIPVFAPADDDEGVETEPVYDIPEWLADNYRQLIADPVRNDSFEKLAERSEKAGETQLAGWARQQAAAAGDDITPVDATAGEPSTTREDGGQ